jgi:hypothetical protein
MKIWFGLQTIQAIKISDLKICLFNKYLKSKFSQPSKMTVLPRPAQEFTREAKILPEQFLQELEAKKPRVTIKYLNVSLIA